MASNERSVVVVDESQQYSSSNSNHQNNDDQVHGDDDTPTPPARSPSKEQPRNNKKQEMTSASPSTQSSSSASSSSTSSSSSSSTSSSRCCNNPITSQWVAFMDVVRDKISRVVLQIAVHAAKHPYTYVFGITITSFALLGIGFVTNFYTTADPQIGMKPFDSESREQKTWITTQDKSGFPPQAYSLRLLIHADGDNVISQEGTAMTFDVVDTVQSVEGYNDFCSHALENNPYGYGGQCHIRGIPLFWNLSSSLFEEEVHSDVDVILAVSATKYPDNSTVDPRELMGYPTYHYETTIISAQSFLMEIAIPAWPEQSFDLAKQVLNSMLDLQKEWQERQKQNENEDDTTIFTLEVYLTNYSLEVQSIEAVFKDLPLIPSVFVLMTLFTCLIFSLSHRPGAKALEPRNMLGLGAVCTICLSMAASYGFLFFIGVPFTSLTQILPFVMFGIGLDDSFIIFGEFIRTDKKKDPVKRIEDTFEEVGLSILLTSLTTAFAFAFGGLSSLPAVTWLSWYAFPTVLVDFLFQITFFVALIVLDERRVQRKANEAAAAVAAEGGAAEQKWTTCCFKKQNHQQENNLIDLEEEPGQDAGSEGFERGGTGVNNSDISSGTSENDRDEILVEPREDDTNEERAADFRKSRQRIQSVELLQLDNSQHYHHHMPGPPASSMDRFMKYYANLLLKKPVKIAVLCIFAVMTVVLVWSASKFRQKLDTFEILPEDSYVSHYIQSVDKYTDRGFIVPQAYFRNVDQSDPEIQQQMEDFVNDLVAMDSISSQPPFFWLRHFKEFLTYDDLLPTLTFNAQLTLFLSVDVFKTLYGDHIVRDPETGDIIASRCVMFMDNIDMTSVDSQIASYREQMRVTKEQPVNSPELIPDGQTFNFFLFEESTFYAFEFFDNMKGELISASVAGMACITVISFLFLPHWSGIFILVPIMAVLYIDLIGFLQFCGVYLNAVNYFTMVMSIGLLVDFNMHILLRYYESPCATRELKVKDSLQTMGSSVVVGGLSTFLGVVPLLFATSLMMRTLFFGFWGMVVIGLSHGVILLPVILSFIGPIRTTPVTVRHMTEDGPTNNGSGSGGGGSTDSNSDSKTSPVSMCGSSPSRSESGRHRFGSDGDSSGDTPQNNNRAEEGSSATPQKDSQVEYISEADFNPVSLANSSDSFSV